MLELKQTNPIECEQWDRLLLSTRGHTVFHSAGWVTALARTYRYKPLYFTRPAADGLGMAIPMMEINSFITGHKGVSLPFTDYCPMIGNNDFSEEEAFHYICDYANRAGWKSVEFRNGNGAPQHLPVSVQYLSHALDLDRSEQEISSHYKSSIHRNLKKAVREGVKIEFSTSEKGVNEFYRLNCLTRKKHGLPPQPKSFFINLHRHLIDRGMGIIALAVYQDACIAGALYLHLGEKAVYKYGASNSKYQHLRANDLVMAEAIKWYASRGFKSLSLGRTAYENSGLRQFKNGWGAAESTISYCKYDILKKALITEKAKTEGFHTKIFSKMPLPLLRLTGTLLYRHAA
jgi:Acetyltransferase (GNAT) domain